VEQFSAANIQMGQYQCPQKSHRDNNALYVGFTSVSWMDEYLNSLPRLNVPTHILKPYAITIYSQYISTQA
jgi:hypothetical protein